MSNPFNKIKPKLTKDFKEFFGYPPPDKTKDNTGDNDKLNLSPQNQQKMLDAMKEAAMAELESQVENLTKPNIDSTKTYKANYGTVMVNMQTSMPISSWAMYMPPMTPMEPEKEIDKCQLCILHDAYEDKIPVFIEDDFIGEISLCPECYEHSTKDRELIIKLLKSEGAIS